MGAHLLRQSLEKRAAMERKGATVAETSDKAFEFHRAAERQAEWKSAPSSAWGVEAA